MEKSALWYRPTLFNTGLLVLYGYIVAGPKNINQGLICYISERLRATFPHQQQPASHSIKRFWNTLFPGVKEEEGEVIKSYTSVTNVLRIL